MYLSETEGCWLKETYNQAASFSCLVLEREVREPGEIFQCQSAVLHRGWSLPPSPPGTFGNAWRQIYCHYCVCMWEDYTYWVAPGMVSSCIIQSTALPTPSKELFSLQCQQCQGWETLVEEIKCLRPWAEGVAWVFRTCNCKHSIRESQWCSVKIRCSTQLVLQALAEGSLLLCHIWGGECKELLLILPPFTVVIFFFW